LKRSSTTQLRKGKERMKRVVELVDEVQRLINNIWEQIEMKAKQRVKSLNSSMKFNDLLHDSFQLEQRTCLDALYLEFTWGKSFLRPRKEPSGGDEEHRAS
jgi:hypothetical protein